MSRAHLARRRPLGVTAAALALATLPRAVDAQEPAAPAAASPARPPGVAASASPATPPQRLSIDEALRLAEAGSEDVSASQAGVDRARAQQLRANSGFLPQISASASYDRTLKSEYEGLFETPATPDPMTGQPTPMQPGTGAMGEAGGVDLRQLPFGRRNIYRFGLSGAQTLFAGGGLVAGRRVAGATRRAAEIAVGSTRAQAVLQVAEAYFDAVLAEKLVGIAESSLAQTERVLGQARVAHQVGSQAEFDLLRAQVAVQNQRPQLLARRLDRERAFLRLRQLLDIPNERPIALTTGLDDEAPAPPPATTAAVAREAAQLTPDPALPRAPVRQAFETLRLREASLDAARAQRLPTLSLVSQYGRVAYPDDLLPAWSEFRTNWTVGLVLQWQLFTGGATTAQIRSAGADVVEARARLRQTEELARLDSATSAQQLAAARATFGATAGTVAQAQRAYEIAELRFSEGVSTQVELTDARLALEQARVTRAQAAREVEVAAVRVALLPALPLATGGSAPPSQGQGAPAQAAQQSSQAAAAAQQRQAPVTGAAPPGAPGSGGAGQFR